VQPGATRQSYQDSDIFGTKQGSEVVQKSAYNDKELRQRTSNTYARSDVLCNDEACQKEQNHRKDGELHHASSTRNEVNWRSEVFAGPKPNPVNRKRLDRHELNRENYYGDETGAKEW